MEKEIFNCVVRSYSRRVTGCELLVKRLATFILLLVMAAGSAQAGIDEYLLKHQSARVTQSQRDRISQFDYLIEYYCALPYLSSGIETHPDFIRALILAESNGDPQAVSPKNARGLTQILYATGKGAAEAITRNPGIDFDRLRYVTRAQLEQLGPEDLHDPAINIMLACYLISKYNEDYQGHLDLVVSAWNAGPGSISNGQPPEFQETLNLIGQINGLFRFLIENNS